MEKVAQTIVAKPPHYFKDTVFRYVLNYDYCFKTFAKQRWIGRNLLEVFISEFKAFSETYYVGSVEKRSALKKQKITVNGNPVDETYVLKNSDLIHHFTIRRELPVYNLPIEKIFEDDEIIVVDKPPSIPVHPCGAYNRNSLVNILAYEEGWTNVSRTKSLPSYSSS